MFKDGKYYCDYCGKEFEPTYKGRKFCSKECLAQSQVKRYNYVCEKCGKPFISKQKNRRFCSQKCANTYRRNREKVVCAYCGKEIERRKSIINKKGNNFCNSTCQGLYERKINEYILHEDYAEIVIDSSKYGRKLIKIDLEDVEKCKIYTWHVSWKDDRLYVATISKKLKINGLYLHRFIMDCPKDKVIDHINNDSFDNRKCNLQIVTRKENAQNSKTPKNNTSGVKGVYWCKRDNVWVTQIEINGKTKNCGRFKDIKDAEKHVIKMRNKYYTNNLIDRGIRKE